MDKLHITPNSNLSTPKSLAFSPSYKCISGSRTETETIFEYPKVASIKEEPASFPLAGRFNRAAKTVMKQTLRKKTRPKTEMVTMKFSYY